MKGILSGSSKTRRGFCPGSANLSEGGFVWRGLCLDTVQNILIKKKVYTLLYDLIYKCYRYLLYIMITCTCTHHHFGKKNGQWNLTLTSVKFLEYTEKKPSYLPIHTS